MPAHLETPRLGRCAVIDAELEARGAGVQDERVVVHRALAHTPARELCRLACATRIATAQLAMRERTLSERLVSTIGTRAPSTSPALSAPARKMSCFARM